MRWGILKGFVPFYTYLTIMVKQRVTTVFFTFYYTFQFWSFFTPIFDVDVGERKNKLETVRKKEKRKDSKHIVW